MQKKITSPRDKRLKKALILIGMFIIVGLGYLGHIGN